MKKIFFTICASILSASLFGQIKNVGFETKKSAESSLPTDWGVAPVVGFTAMLVNDVKFSGENSFRISSKENSSNYLNVTQTIDIDTKELKRIKLTAYIKTEDLKGAAALWCQLWDGNKKMVGFENLSSQGQVINGTTDWKKYTLTLIVGPNIKKLFFGAYSLGSGTSWFDDFAIEEFEGGNEPASSAVIKYSNEFNSIVKKHSIYTDSLDWTSIDKDLKSLGKGLKTVEDAKVLTNYVLQQLRKAGDNHSFVQNKVAAEKYASSNTAQDTVISKLLPNNIGYISVPAFGSTNKEVGEQFAQKIQSQIKKLDTENEIKGWVVDLRRNGGGNMYPMIAGLKPLIGNGTLGYFVKGKSKIEWKSYVKVTEAYTLKNQSNNIAVLIGPRTGSSGEMTAITFIGKPNTKFFGEPSAGYITANSMHALSDGSNLLLASSYSADRNGKKYLDRIYPEVVAKSTATNDLALEMAAGWILGR